MSSDIFREARLILEENPNGVTAAGVSKRIRERTGQFVNDHRLFGLMGGLVYAGIAVRVKTPMGVVLFKPTKPRGDQ